MCFSQGSQKTEKECKKVGTYLGFFFSANKFAFITIQLILLLLRSDNLREKAEDFFAHNDSGQEEEISEVYAILTNKYSQNKHNAMVL
jgi:hypothetical protein